MAALFAVCPWLIGSNRSLAEAIGWNLIIGMFLGPPFALLYGVVFGTLWFLALQPWVTLALAAAVPSAAVLLFSRIVMGEQAARNQWPVWLAGIGGLAGGAIFGFAGGCV